MQAPKKTGQPKKKIKRNPKQDQKAPRGHRPTQPTPIYIPASYEEGL